MKIIGEIIENLCIVITAPPMQTQTEKKKFNYKDKKIDVNTDVYSMLVAQKITQLLSIEIEERLKKSSYFHSNRLTVVIN